MAIDQKEVDRLNARLRRISAKAHRLQVEPGYVFGRDEKIAKLREEYRRVAARRDVAKTQQVLELVA